jgi:hypothetical protein
MVEGSASNTIAGGEDLVSDALTFFDEIFTLVPENYRHIA